MGNHSDISARSLALEALEMVLHRGRSPEEAFGNSGALEQRDAHFARAMVMEALKRLGQVDALLGAYMERPLPENLRRVKNILRLGVAQLVWLDTPAYAAVNSMVELTPSSHKGLVNAVLKRVSRDGKTDAASLDPLLNIPPWLRENWVASYGEESTRAVALAHIAEPPLDITVKENPVLWAEKVAAERVFADTLRLQDRTPVTQLPGYAEGAWWVQDAAAAWPARLLGEVKGKQVLDLCAAPGGKTAQLIAAGAHVIAVDRSAPRMRTLKENLKRLGMEAECVVADALEYAPPFVPEMILLDAPCSATGTLRRHPEIAWQKAPEDIKKLVVLQEKLLNRAVDMLASGGMLVYAVCSLEKEEGEAQITRLLANRADVARWPLEALEVGGITPEGDLRLLPSHLHEKGGMDGFFASRLKRL